MLRTAFLASLALMLCAGCGSKVPSAKETYVTFHKSLVKHSREGNPAYQEQAYKLLDQASQARLTEAADAVNAALPEGITAIEPSEMLRVGHLVAGEDIDEVDIAELGGGVLMVTAKAGEITSKVRMVREGAGWRISLFDAPNSPN